MNKILSYAWAGMFLLCAGLGTIQDATGLAKVALIIISVLFFLPPALILYNNLVADRPGIVRRIRKICIASLALTTVTLTVFFVVTLLAAGGAVQPAAVNVVYYILLVVSSPLFCGQYFFLSIFLWACLLFATFIKLPEHRRKKTKK